MATAERDYYELLGVERTATRGRDQEGVPEARARAAPGRLAGAGRAGALSRRRRGVRGALQGRDAPAVRPLRPRGPQARRLHAERLRLLEPDGHLLGLLRRRPVRAQPRRPRTRRRRRRRRRDRARRRVHRRRSGPSRSRSRRRASAATARAPSPERSASPARRAAARGSCSRSRAASSASSCARRRARPAAAPAASPRSPCTVCEGAGRTLESRRARGRDPGRDPRRPADPDPRRRACRARTAASPATPTSRCASPATRASSATATTSSRRST